MKGERPFSRAKEGPAALHSIPSHNVKLFIDVWGYAWASPMLQITSLMWMRGPAALRIAYMDVDSRGLRPLHITHSFFLFG